MTRNTILSAGKTGEGGVTQGHAMLPVISLSQLAADLSAAVLFCTRLPVPGAATITGADIARAGWALPIAGAIVGLTAAAAYWLARGPVAAPSRPRVFRVGGPPRHRRAPRG